MLTSSKYICRAIASLLASYGVKDVVLSPGSRVAPLTMAVTAVGSLRCHTVIDERRAAFEALGMALVSQRPVALCCTSGSALLNYAPALAEAYYRRVPLIVLSADRPGYIIDQDDSQTIRQPGALANVVKQSYVVDGDASSPMGVYAAVRDINAAFDKATDSPQGPVHVNVTLDEPLNGVVEPPAGESVRVIKCMHPRRELSPVELSSLAARMASPRRVAVICGFGQPDTRMTAALRRLTAVSDVSVWAEITSNVNVDDAVSNIDDTLRMISDDDGLRPELAIVCGGAPVSRSLKEYLRQHTDIELWRVGEDDRLIDTYYHLDVAIDMSPELFFRRIASSLRHTRDGGGYASRISRLSRMAGESVDDGCRKAESLTQLAAMHHIFRTMDRSVNLQLSNGLTVRLASKLRPVAHRIDCNRGVSGIDGSTSTAVGAARIYSPGVTLLLSGDMSAAYDMAPLLDANLPDGFKAVIFDNRGGAIFRTIDSTRHLPVCERHLAVGDVFNYRLLAGNPGLTLIEADDMTTMRQGLQRLMGSSRAAVMIVHVTG